MRTRTLTMLVAGLGLAAAAPAANAATIAYEGSTLVYSDQGGAVDDIILSVQKEWDTQVDMLHFYEYAGTPISFPGDRCKSGSDYVACDIPSALRVVLGGGDDEFILQSFHPTMPVTMLGGDGNDLLKDDYEGTGPRRFEGGAGNDTIEAYKGNDVLLGEAGNDTLKGGAGADEVRGGDGDDTLEGDKYESPAADVLDGGPGFDIVEEWSIPTGSTHPPARVTQDGVADDGRPGEGDNVTGIEKITSSVNGHYEGTDGADDIWITSHMAGGESTIRGFAGNDKLTGRDNPETIDGGPGDDTIQGGFGNDTIVGGPGKDRINGDGGSYCGIYSCTVPYGDDTIDVRDGEVDEVECGIGNDTVRGDSIDRISTSCENVDLGGGSGGGGSGGGGTGGVSGGGGTGVDPASVGFALVGRPSTRKGLRFRVTCPGACQVSGELRLKGRRIATGRRTLLAAGTATVAVKPTKAGRKRLRRARRAKVRLAVSIRDGAGAVKTLSRTVVLKR